MPTRRSSFRIDRLVLLCAAALLAGAAATPAGAQDAHELRLDLEEGERYRFTTTNDQNVQQQVMGRQIDVATKQTAAYRYDVTDVADDGTIRLTVTYERLKMERTTPNGSTSYDSADTSAAPPPGMQGMEALIGKTFQMQLAPSGEVTSVEGMKPIMDAVMEESDAPPAMREQMRKQFGGESMKSLMGAAFAYAGTAAQVGDTWERSFDLTRGFPMAINMTYTLDAVEDDVATLSVSSQIGTPEDVEPMTVMGGGELDMTLSGTQQGATRVDLDTGLPVRAETEQQMSGTGEVSMQAQTIPMEMSIDGTTTTTVEPVE